MLLASFIIALTWHSTLFKWFRIAVSDSSTNPCEIVLKMALCSPKVLLTRTDVRVFIAVEGTEKYMDQSIIVRRMDYGLPRQADRGIRYRA